MTRVQAAEQVVSAAAPTWRMHEATIYLLVPVCQSASLAQQTSSVALADRCEYRIFQLMRFHLARALTGLYHHASAPRWLHLLGLARRLEASAWPPVTIRRDFIRWRLTSPNDNVDRAIFYQGVYEPESSAFIRQVVKPGWTCVDVGANSGYITALLANLAGPSGRVLAIEPSRTFGSRLNEHIAVNGISDRVVIERCAVGDVEGQLELLEAGCTATFLSRADTPNPMRQAVEVRRLDALVAKHGLTDIRFIKIDTDGFEAPVVRGAMETILEYRPILLVECVTEYGIKPDSFIDMLAPLGYRIDAVLDKINFACVPVDAARS
jgi:FkbM family methyltransferase